jgi:hypothetical protein
MDTIAGFPYFKVEYTKDGDAFNPAQEQAVLQQLPGDVTDLYVASHGWNNDMAEAQALYEKLFGFLASELPHSPAAGRKFAVVGVFWPSKKFAEESLIAGGGAASFDAGAGRDVDEQLDALAALLHRDRLPQKETALPADPDVEKARAAAAKLSDPEADHDAAQSEFVEAMRAILQRVGAPDASDKRDDGASFLMTAPASELFDALGAPPRIVPPPSAEGEGGALGIGDGQIGGSEEGGGAGFGGFFRSLADRARDLANLTTYYTMKKRAGTVGERGVIPLVDKIQAARPALRIHLVGHSFGGRLVTAVANKAAKPVASMALLQAAYSHNGLGDNGQGLVGAFRGIVTNHKVKGPIVISHTHNDRAVGIAYAIASRLAGDNASAFVGGVDDQYGGMGGNGAQNASADASFKLLKGTPKQYAFQPAKIYNLNADAVITGHSDIKSGEVACVMLSAVAAT